MSDPIFFAPLRVPITDSRTGLMSREWYLFFQAMYLRVGGTTAPTNDDLQLISDMSDATDDGSDIRASVADLERAVMLIEEPELPADISELQALSASFAEDPIIARFTAQWDGLTPASGGGTVKFLRADGAWAIPSYPTVPVGANPSATIGLAAVNGSAATFMTSDSAPALSQAITPTWSGLHKFNVSLQALLVGTTAITSVMQPTAQQVVYSILGPSATGQFGPGIQARWDGGTANRYLALGYYDNSNVFNAMLTLTAGGDSQFAGKLGVNNATPPAQVTGFGTPTGTGVIANFPGATATLAQCSQAIAQIIKDLKAFGLYAA